MKKKFLLSLSCFLCLVMMARAQDFEPGQQAQGYLNSKNVVVDHATGIFHYKVPLFTLGSGDFQLPISLDYSAKGVKEEDQQGLIGYNWILNTGGVVTRTIRGGVADEALTGGRLWVDWGNNVTSEMIKRVNKRQLDGESDIFTVVFNGQSVNFIITMDQYCKIYAKPLQRTNVRIECESSRLGEINGWVVTDESGNRYIYRQKEWTVNIVKEDAVSSNGIRDYSHVSSWYINRVEPCNGEPIIFNYSNEVCLSGKQSGINLTTFFSEYKSMYVYGSPMYERVLDFSSYRSKFDAAIKEARDLLSHISLEQQLNNKLYLYIDYGDWVRNPNFEFNVEAINANFRIMGQLGNFQGMGEASGEVVQILNDLISIYSGSGEYTAKQAVECFIRAKSYVTQSLDESHFVYKREGVGGTAYTVRSPLLQNITCQGKMIEIGYKDWLESKFISYVKFMDVFRGDISKVVLVRKQQLDTLIFLGKNAVEVNRINFGYHEKPLNVNLKADGWGYPKRKTGEEGEDFHFAIDAEYSKVGTLKSVATTNGGEIIVDYEPNCYRGEYDFGGIRVKSLFFKDSGSNTFDKVFYRYPLRGVPVFTVCSNTDVVSYGGFSDNVVYSRVKYKGLSYVNAGNNGLYYPYVQEVIPGKGTKAYLFNVPQYPDAYWLTGLPLGMAVYDDNGNLNQLVKYKYSSQLLGETMPNEYISAIDTSLNYKYTMPQVKIYEYYMDREFLDSYYRNQGRVQLYSGCYVDIYREVYLPNIQPRTYVQMPNQVYNIRYGGRTLLKEKVEYRFKAHETDSAAYSDFYTRGRLETPFEKIEYVYDNMQGSGYPTRVIKTDSKGNRYTTISKRVTEIADGASPFVLKMKTKNMLTPVIKETRLKDDDILVENVAIYDAWETDSISHVGLSKQYAYYPVSAVSLSPSYMLGLDMNLFTYGQGNYRLEQAVEYQKGKHSYLPVGVEGNLRKSVYCHDLNYGQVILKADQTRPQSVAAVDFRKHGEATYVRGKISNMMLYYDPFVEFYEAYQGVDISQQPEEYQNYTSSDGYRMVMDLISVIATGKSMLFDEYRDLIDGVLANRWHYFNEFIEKHLQLGSVNPSLACLPEILSDVNFVMTRGVVQNVDFFNYRSFLGQKEYLNRPGSIEITSLPESKRLRLFVLSNGGETVTYTVTHSGGKTTGNVQLSSSEMYKVQAFGIDLSPYVNVTSVRCQSTPSMVYMALLPDDVAFEAKSYNLDGTVFCTFDQTGRLELNEYDEAGRLTRVTDQHGDVVKEYHHYTVIP